MATPIVVAIHDLSFVAHPEWFRIREGARRRWLTRQSASKASAVITISEFSKGELIGRLNVPERRIHVIPPGIDGIKNSELRIKNARPGPRVLFVGSIFNRRHVGDLIRAFATLARAHPDASLDIVGDNRSYPREDLRRTIVEGGLGDRVRWHEYVSDAELRDLYAQARAFAFLSEYEGLGLTPLEALAAGVPPVLLDTAVARESCGDAAVYVPVGDGPATTRALEAVLFDEATRSRILDAAPHVLAKYSWPRAAQETLAVLESVSR
jgi:glycosyltransferase involved in cell wall biosynthesis